MSINWNYFKRQANTVTSSRGRTRELQMYAHTATGKDLEAFTGMLDDQRKEAKNGRSWRAEELRLKSHSDLHKLWYVLLKEKNKIKSDFLMAKQLGQIYFGHNDLKKVRLSMSRLLTVVNERKRARALYRAHLEDEFIAKQKRREANEFLISRERLRAAGHKNLPLTPEEVKGILRRKELERLETMHTARADINRQLQTRDGDGATPTAAPEVSSKDLDFVAQAKAKLTQRDILKMYVGNWAELDLKQRRKVMAFVQAQRTKHAKQIFLKELSALGRKMKQQGAQEGDSPQPVEGVLGRKDPVKLRLEQVTV